MVSAPGIPGPRRAHKTGTPADKSWDPRKTLDPRDIPVRRKSSWAVGTTGAAKASTAVRGPSTGNWADAGPDGGDSGRSAGARCERASTGPPDGSVGNGDCDQVNCWPNFRRKRHRPRRDDHGGAPGVAVEFAWSF